MHRTWSWTSLALALAVVVAPTPGQARPPDLEPSQTPPPSSGPGLSEPDGIRYVVVRTETRVRPDITRCGTYGESPAAVPAEFRVEHRQYTEYAKGRVVRRWMEQSEQFVRCRAP